MEKSGFHLSLLGGELKALATRKSATTGTWACPDSVSDFVGLATVLRRALDETNAKSHTVSIVLAHPLLSDQIMEAPPVKGRTLERLLDRHVKSLKAFPGDPVWSSQPALSTKKGNTVLLHICPRFVLDHLTRSCRGAGLHLSRVVPTTSLLIAQLKQLPLQKGEIALLVAETGPTTTLVIGNAEGRVCLGRILRETWRTEAERVAVDLTRSIGYAEQQSGVTVSRVWLFGESAADHLPALQTALRLPVEVSPVPYTPFYWTEQLARLPAKGDGNLVSLEAREAPQRRRYLTVTSVLLFLLLAASLGAAGFLEILRRNQLREIENLNAEIANLQADQAKLQADFAEFERMKDFVRVVSDEKPPPVPSWFLAYLGEVVPDDLMLTQLRVARTNNLWSVRMEGGVRPDAKTALPEQALVQGLNSLSNSLVTGPFHLTMVPEATEAPAPSPVRQFLRRFGGPEPPRPSTSQPAADPSRFVIEGVMQ